jgi:hypothetical protein
MPIQLPYIGYDLLGGIWYERSHEERKAKSSGNFDESGSGFSDTFKQ